jgi:6,7-dimethyl-8-ribityllumazine synthase
MSKEKKSKPVKIAIVISRFNKEITDGLLKGALIVLTNNNIEDKNTDIIYCPGAFEITLTAKKLCETKKYSAVICLGAVIKGETAHFEYISYSVTHGILQLNLEYGIPVTYGVLTCYTEEQAAKRSGDDSENKGAEAASAALEMIGLIKEIG